MNITATDLKNTSRNINDAGKIAKLISASVKRTSLTRMTQDSIFQFPVIISNGMPSTASIMDIAKGLERQFATLMLSAISMRSSYDVDRYPTVADYLGTFHSNKNVPSNIKAATNFLLESATTLQHHPDMTDVALECWSDIENRLCMESVNDVYQPYIRTAALLTSRLEMATEATSTNTLHDVATAIGEHYDDRASMKEKSSKDKPTVPTMPKVDNAKISAMEPTMISATFIGHGANQGKWEQTVVLGIKTMIRLVRSDLMVENMCECAKGANVVFKFIKWTNRELSFWKDVVLGISDAREDAVSKDNRWARALQRRKKVSNVATWFDNKLLPNSTIIITSFEAAQIASECGVDLTQIYNVMKLVSKYFLLAFGIYNTETEILTMFFDGDSEFSDISISSLQSNNKKDVDLTNTKDVLKLIGRI